MSSGRVAENGQNARLLRALVWAGVGLAPIAALVVLLGDSVGPVRLGVLLIAVCVVLVGASLLVRNDPVLLRMHVEDRVADEVSALRDELRSEFAASHAPMTAAPVAAAPMATAPVAAAPPRPAGAASRRSPMAAAAVPGPPALREPSIRTGGRAVPGQAVSGASVGAASVGGAAAVG